MTIMVPSKITTQLARNFVSARPHLAGNVMSDLDRAAAKKIAAHHDISPEEFMNEIDAEIDWLDHKVPA